MNLENFGLLHEFLTKPQGKHPTSLTSLPSHANLTKADAGRQLDGINQSISSALKFGDSETLVGFPRRNVWQRCAYAQHNAFLIY